MNKQVIDIEKFGLTIPKELVNYKQWVLWRYEDKDGKQIKVPYSYKGYRADVTNPQDGASFENVLSLYNENCQKYDGVGFVFRRTDPFVFIDFDSCIDDNGRIDPKVEKYLKLLNSYTEKSVSGKGIHVIIKGIKPQWCGNRKGNIEIYNHSRFAVMTGDRVFEYPNTIEERQTALEQLCREVFGEPQTQTEKEQVTSQLRLSDEQIIKLCSNNEKFKKLMAGDWSDYPSPSEADLALCSIIAFHTKDPDQILKIIRRSKLWDEKWKREDYQKRTIEKALSRTTTYWQQTEQQLAITRFFDNGVFIPKYLADEIMSEYQFICVDRVLYVYIDGAWRPIGDDFVEHICYQKLGQQARANRVTEVVKYIQAMTRTDREKLNSHKELINLKNGMLNLHTFELKPHDPTYYSTIQIPIVYDPDADASEILLWLNSTFGGDSELVNLACELFGYCLIPDTTMCKAFMLTGTGANGKSTFLIVLENFIGKDNVSKVPLQELAEHRFKRAELFGKLVNLFADLDCRALESTTYFKTIVSGDSIDAERKHRDPFFFEPFARLVFSANEIPRARDRSYAYYRRWCIIPFEQRFEGLNEIKGYAQELCKPENLSALLNLALKGLQRVFDNEGFTEPIKVKIALEEYQRQNDPVKAFIDEQCKFDNDAETDRLELYSAFCQFCDEEGYHKVTRNAFYDRIRALPQVMDVKKRYNRVFKGIKYTKGG